MIIKSDVRGSFMSVKILIVEDEKLIAEMVQFNLEREGYEVALAFDGISAVQKVEKFRPDLIVLDIMLPGLNGFEVCKQVRKKYTMPIIMLTAKETEKDKVQGLTAGADDYVTKPFSPRELLARVQAQLRRANIFNREEAATTNFIEIGTLSLDLQKYEVTKQGETLPLSIREFELLKFMVLQPGKAFSRAELLKEVWGYEDYFGDDRTVDVTIRRLREKVEDQPSHPQYIITKRGVGYYFQR